LRGSQGFYSTHLGALIGILLFCDTSSTLLRGGSFYNITITSVSNNVFRSFAVTMKNLSVLFTLKRLLFLLLIGSILWLSFSCQRPDEFPVGHEIRTGAELKSKKGNQFRDENGSEVFFTGGNLQTDEVAHTGKYAVLTIPKKAFAFAFELKHAGPDWYFKVSVWRKSKDGKGALVITSKDVKDLYVATTTVVETREDGWEKLEVEAQTPPFEFNKSIKIYVWNNGADTVYFDDIVIERFRYKIYPDYKEEPLVIILDTSEYLKLAEKRLVALRIGILQTEETDWVKGIVFGEDKMMKAGIRLKGDWLDHLKGDKWSLRVKLKKKYAWHRFRTFSVQTPEARSFMYEWLAHGLFSDQDILTTRYGFIPLILNNRSRGVFAWEEHFEKHLLEFRNRREGPIVKFTEEAFWQVQRLYIENKKWPDLPYFEASVIKPFKEGNTLENPVLKAQFLNAQKLMQQYKYGLKKANEIFDIDRLGAYYAMLELTQGFHGIVWHNQRFYFNPVLCKLEPIAFDGFSASFVPDTGIYINPVRDLFGDGLNLGERAYALPSLFRDSLFTNEYLKYLREFSEEKFVISVLDSLKPDIIRTDSLLKLEFKYYSFDPEYLVESARYIREYLPELTEYIHKEQLEGKQAIKDKNYSYDQIVLDGTPEYFVQAYTENILNDTAVISIYNYNPEKMLILGTGRKEKYVDNFQHPEPEIDAYDGSKLHKLNIVSDTSAVFLMFMIKGYDETFTTRISLWPYPSGETPQQELITAVNLDNAKVFDRIEGKNIYIKQENIQVDHPLIIPEGYNVHFNSGVILDFIKGAMFISYSPVFMNGVKDNPVIITSSDFSAKGFTVLQANTRSKIKHVVFKNLNTLDYKGWTLTGAVTFYESDVDISNTLFYRNQCEDALNTIRSDFRLEKSTFNHIYSDAFDSDYCTGLVTESRFINIGNDAIDFSGSQIHISDTEIVEANDKGISGGEDSYLTIENTTILRSNIGLAAKDLSLVNVKNSSIKDCSYGIVLLQKKPEYGPAVMELLNTEIFNSKTKMLVEKGSRVIIDGVTIDGNEKNVSELFY